MDAHRPRSVLTVLFDDFELLDVCGPLEVLGQLPEHFTLVLAGPRAGSVPSTQGPRLHASHSYADAPPCDVVLVPGGLGTRRLVGDDGFLRWLAARAGTARVVLSVCTGAALLAAAGLLDGYEATSNKRAYEWVVEQGPDVRWVAEARWVHDRDRWTSSGVAAGIDMTLAFVAEALGRDVAVEVAEHIEHDWHEDSTWDPFAALAKSRAGRPTEPT